MDQQTLDFYNKNAKEYAATTLNGDVAEIREKFLQYVPQGGKILDLGCGSGRDSLAFKKE
ncbi:MAG: SAM-dependent methyltransferase, partial [Cellulosilyticaceae bacterium]